MEVGEASGPVLHEARLDMKAKDRQDPTGEPEKGRRPAATPGRRGRPALGDAQGEQDLDKKTETEAEHDTWHQHG
jgi:hypothetical protein